MKESSERYPLQYLLVEDLFSSNKLVAFLLILILLSATATIWITHQTRGLISENGQLIVQHQALEDEYRNLQLEEATQGDMTRVTKVATEILKMQPVKPEQEVILESEF
ncbi:cell division protein FtsL [Rodentibacter caecimuris]|uniref:Cell division protein FtsL n=1 Tax=Rodentibacter caecimuris TaxID=1796644 RepID=A0ABX3KXP9_9PAST|nr:cell division protein FtsL [Rodentibacter heylii]